MHYNGSQGKTSLSAGMLVIVTLNLFDLLLVARCYGMILAPFISTLSRSAVTPPKFCVLQLARPSFPHPKNLTQIPSYQTHHQNLAEADTQY